MKNCSFLKRLFIGAVIVSTTMTMTMPSQGWAMLAPAQSGDAAGNRAEDLKTIQKALESEVVRQRLADLKLTPEEIDSRLDKLSDEQLHQTARRVQTLNPGGSVGGVLVLVVLVLLIIFLVRRV